MRKLIGNYKKRKRNIKPGKRYKKHESIKNNGVNVLCNLPNAYFILGTGQKTIKSATLSYDDVTFGPNENYITDIQYDNNGDGTVPYESEAMLGLLDGKKMKGEQPVDNLETSFGSIDLIGKEGEIKSVYLEDGVYRVNLNGTDTGTMDLALRWFDDNNDQVTDKEFLQIPVTANTLMYIDTLQDGTSELKVDTDGDGTIDDTWYSAEGDVGYRIIEDDNNSNNEENSDNNETQKAEEPAKPSDTSTPVTNEPAVAQPVAVQKASASPAKTTGTVTKASNTGDTNYIALWITLSVVATGIATALIISYNRRKKED